MTWLKKRFFLILGRTDQTAVDLMISILFLGDYEGLPGTKKASPLQAEHFDFKIFHKAVVLEHQSKREPEDLAEKSKVATANFQPQRN